MGGWVWSEVDVVVPCSPLRLPGVGMAGFRRGAAPGSAGITMIPHPGITVIIDLSSGDGIHARTPGGQARGSFVAGLVPGEVRASAYGPGECLQIRLDPTVLGRPAHRHGASVLDSAADLAGTVVPLEDVRTEERLRAAASWEERFAIVTALLGRRWETRRPVDAEVAHVWRRIRAGRGRPRVDELAAEVGWSRKRLWSRFRAQVGVTPKHAARLVRFDHAAHLLAAGRPPAAVAATSGYADQPHLHREMRAFTGLSPAAVAGAPWLAIDGTAWPARGIQ